MNDAKELLKKMVPNKIKKALKDVAQKYFIGYAQKSYSQEGEDMILMRIFKGQKEGFYVDVGAFHPQISSNTYGFYKKGWHGINIDATPGSMQLFNKIRPRDINIEKPISDKKEKMIFNVFNAPNMNTFSSELSDERNGLRNYRKISEIRLDSYTLSEILDEFLPSGQQIDFLSIDVEGLDFKVLNSNNWQKYRPKVVVIELLKTKLDDIFKDKVYSYLVSQGYSLFAKAYYSIIFLRED